MRCAQSLGLWKGRSQCVLDRYLRQVASDTRPRQTINLREQDVLDGAVAANRPLQRLGAEYLTDLVVDISKSTGRAPWRVGATPCVLPNSRVHWRREQRVLDAREMCAMQGIWTHVFVAFESWCKSEKQSRVLMDLAGNAFTSGFRDRTSCQSCHGQNLAAAGEQIGNV